MRELMPSATTTRSASRIAGSTGDISVWYLISHAERAGAPAQDLQQGRARAAAEAVAADAVGGAAEMDLDVVPIGEVADDGAVALAVVGLEGVERLVGEHHAEAEGVVRPVALEHGDAGLRPRLLHQDREIEAGRAAADHVNFHAAPLTVAPMLTVILRCGLAGLEGLLLGLKYLPDKLEVLKILSLKDIPPAGRLRPAGPRQAMALAGKHAFVTGGGRGIGRAVAAALTGAGAVVTVSGRSEKPLREAVAAGAAAGFGVADVTDAAQVGTRSTPPNRGARPDRHPGQQCRVGRDRLRSSRPIRKCSRRCGTST